MLKLNPSKYIWIIGVPRSGTTFFTNYLSQYVDLCYNEPWDKYDLNSPAKWKFPKKNIIVFKYCANWVNADALHKNFRTSYFIHIIRKPSDVVHSMVFPKPDSVPYRNLFETKNTQERFRLAVSKWKMFLLGSQAVCNKFNGLEIVYERLPKEIERVKDFLNLPLSANNMKFKFKQSKDNNYNLLEKYWHLPNYRDDLLLRQKIEQAFFSNSLKEL